MVSSREAQLPSDAGSQPSPAKADTFQLTTDPAVHDLKATADRLAETLGFSGSASTSEGGRAYGDGHTQVLVIDHEPGLQWAYTRDGVRCTDVGPSDAGILSACAPIATGDDWDPEDPRRTPLSPDQARTAAAPVFEVLGMDPAAADITTGWGTTLVSVEPTIDGLRTVGLGTGVVVDKHGILSAAGWLGTASRAASYPVSKAPVDLGPADFGLARWTGKDEKLMVPAWIGRRGDPPEVRVIPAIEADYLPEYMSPVPQ